MFSLLTQNDAEKTKSFLLNHFFPAEPISKVLNLELNEISTFLDYLIEKAVEEQLSVIAKDDLNNIIGCIISQDYFQVEPNKTPQISPKFDSLFALLDELAIPFIEKNEAMLSNYIHILIIATSIKGISSELTEYALQIGKKKGYTKAVLEATGVISQGLVQHKLNFVELNRILYSEFKFNNKLVFENITTSDSCVFFEKSLS